MSSRRATHAGSWYTNNRERLAAELQRNLDKVHHIPELDYEPPINNVKAIIAPHAGYSYSGSAAAWAYASIPVQQIRRVFLLGPSHHAYLSGAALSKCLRYETPLGHIDICQDTMEELRRTGAFADMSLSVDEAEHSLEMHLPYIRHIFAGKDDIRLVPIMVGHPSHSQLQQLNKIFEPFWQDPETFFVISSDFCHWGKRFSCTPYYPDAPHPANPVPPVTAQPDSVRRDKPPQLVKRFEKLGKAEIWESIQYMDHEAMDILREPAAEGAAEAWEAYLSRTKNTICGRNPITVLLSLIQHIYTSKNAPAALASEPGPYGSDSKPTFTFVRYEQSSQCEDGDDSSVSYVSGVLRL